MKFVFLLFCGLHWTSGFLSAAPAFPVKASSDGRFLTDAVGKPFFYHSDTAWQIVKNLKPEEMNDYLDDRQKRGFTAIQIQCFSRELTPTTTWDGLEPFTPIDDILKPNEKYWERFDHLVRAAETRGLLLAVAPIWLRWGGADKAGWRYQFNDENAAGFGNFLAARYGHHKHIIWILGGDANPIEDTHAVARLGRALFSKAPHQLITVHNRPEYSSAAFFESEPWLGINMAYSYGDVYIHVLGEWNRLGRVRPIILGESGYEEESNDARGGSAARCRRQAYEAVLSGALGGHAFGQKHIWRMDKEWRRKLDSPATLHMAHFKKLILSYPWHQLEPDDQNAWTPSERIRFGKSAYVSAARSKDRTLAWLYFPTNLTTTVNLTAFQGKVTAQWYDPTDGNYQPAQGSPFDNSGSHEFTPPMKNAEGDSDFVLTLDAGTKER